jgi:hypothetical protein
MVGVHSLGWLAALRERHRCRQCPDANAKDRPLINNLIDQQRTARRLRSGDGFDDCGDAGAVKVVVDADARSGGSDDDREHDQAGNQHASDWYRGVRPIGGHFIAVSVAGHAGRVVIAMQARVPPRTDLRDVLPDSDGVTRRLGSVA